MSVATTNAVAISASCPYYVVIGAINTIVDAVNIIRLNCQNIDTFNTVLCNIGKFNEYKKEHDNTLARACLRNVIDSLLMLLTSVDMAIVLDNYDIDRVVRIIEDLETITDNIIDNIRECKRFESLCLRNRSLSSFLNPAYIRYCQQYGNWSHVDRERFDRASRMDIHSMTFHHREDIGQPISIDNEHDDRSTDRFIDYQYNEYEEQTDPEISSLTEDNDEQDILSNNSINSDTTMSSNTAVINAIRQIPVGPTLNTRTIHSASLPLFNRFINESPDDNSRLDDSALAFVRTFSTLMSFASSGLQYPESGRHPINISRIIEPSKLKQSDVDLLKNNNPQCAICIEHFAADDSVIYLPCFHVFHENCITNALQTTSKCPLCNMDIIRLLNGESNE